MGVTILASFKPKLTVCKQSSYQAEREKWAAQVRDLVGGRKGHKDWSLDFDPPLKLKGIKVTLVEPKNPSNIGSVARAMNCFECAELVLVNPKCNHLSRSAMIPSKGAQYILWNSQISESLSEAAQDCNCTIAFSRWASGHRNFVQSLSSFEKLHEIQQWCSEEQEATSIMLVFGREYQGLSEAEVEYCDYACSIPIGRLQESLSISHAAAIPLSRLFELKCQ